MSTRTKHREVRGGVVAKKSVRIRQQHFSKSSEGQIPGVLDFGPAIRDPLIDLLWRKNGTDRPSYRGPQESPPPPTPGMQPRSNSPKSVTSLRPHVSRLHLPLCRKSRSYQLPTWPGRAQLQGPLATAVLGHHFRKSTAAGDRATAGVNRARGGR